MIMIAPDGVETVIRRSAAIDKLIRLMVHPATGLVPLCYHRYNSFVDEETGRSFETHDELEEYIESGRKPEGESDDEARELFIPT